MQFIDCICVHVMQPGEFPSIEGVAEAMAVQLDVTLTPIFQRNGEF